MSDIFEGTIIRVMRRLEELLRQLAVVIFALFPSSNIINITWCIGWGGEQAAKSIGNTVLEEKFTAGIAKLKRDIVFAASLYL
jgi:ATP-dependent RNA helicase DOB1